MRSSFSPRRSQPIFPPVKQTLDRRNLERTTCSVLPREFHLVSADPAVRARGVDYLSRCVERTAELGAKVMCGPLYAGLGLMTGSRRTEKEWEGAVQGLRSVASRAEKLGVTLCIEPLTGLRPISLTHCKTHLNWSTISECPTFESISTRSTRTLKSGSQRLHFGWWQRILDTSIFPKMTEASRVADMSTGAEFCLCCRKLVTTAG